MKKTLAVLASVMLVSSLSGCERQTQTCTVTGKESINNSNGHQYRVYTDECGSFVNEDSMIHGKFDSADVQGSIKEDTTYEIDSFGWRVPFLSMFPNIIEATEISED